MNTNRVDQPVGESVLPDLADTLEHVERNLFTPQATSTDDKKTTAASSSTCGREDLKTMHRWRDDVGDWWGPVTKIIDGNETEAAFQDRFAMTTGTDANRLTSAMKMLRRQGELRRLAVVPTNWRQCLNQLESDFPNFVEVVDYLRSAFALSVCGNHVPQVEPMLLNGPPGVGKTYFAARVTEILDSGFVRINMETAQSASRLSGSAEYWSNTRPGAVYETLVKGLYANPTFFIDEIDKACGGEHDPLASLYSLLERHTAADFVDESFPWVHLDASRIMWIATSNDAEAVGDAILSRLRRFDIPAPTGKQSRHIAQMIFDGVLSDLPETVQRTMRLSPSALEILSTMSPRQIRMVVRESIGRAVYHERCMVWPRDLPVVQHEVMEPRRIGFLG